jgi:hypothetical protein
MTGNDQEVFRKVGRGGAGNFYSVKNDEAPADKVLLVSTRMPLACAHLY